MVGQVIDREVDLPSIVRLIAHIDVYECIRVPLGGIELSPKVSVLTAVSDTFDHAFADIGETSAKRQLFLKKASANIDCDGVLWRNLLRV